jgi:hypothetical protein
MQYMTSTLLPADSGQISAAANSVPGVSGKPGVGLGIVELAGAYQLML